MRGWYTCKSKSKCVFTSVSVCVSEVPILTSCTGAESSSRGIGGIVLQATFDFEVGVSRGMRAYLLGGRLLSQSLNVNHRCSMQEECDREVGRE